MMRTLGIVLFLLPSFWCFSQQPAQTMRGTITDEASNQPVAYATVKIQNTNIGTVADSLGNFMLKNISVGRYNIEIFAANYEPAVFKEIQVTSAKEIILNFTMKERVTIP